MGVELSVFGYSIRGAARFAFVGTGVEGGGGFAVLGSGLELVERRRVFGTVCLVRGRFSGIRRYFFIRVGFGFLF